MAAIAEDRLTLEEFRERYAGEKPYFEYWDGRAIQKSMPTRLHSLLEILMVAVLNELGYYAYVEVALHIDRNWQPIPDVIGEIDQREDPYPTQPVDVVIEILSPDDRFSLVQEKCERYANRGIKDILVMDPVGQKAWYWNHGMRSLMSAPPEYGFHNCRTLVFEDVWNRLKV